MTLLFVNIVKSDSAQRLLHYSPSCVDEINVYPSQDLQLYVSYWEPWCCIFYVYLCLLAGFTGDSDFCQSTVIFCHNVREKLPLLNVNERRLEHDGYTKKPEVPDFLILGKKSLKTWFLQIFMTYNHQSMCWSHQLVCWCFWHC